MARKDLLKSLMDAGPSDPKKTALPPRSAKGAIGAVSQSIAELREKALIEVPADMIDNAGLEDRLDIDEDGIQALVESLRTYGQQVPVLLRHSPNYEGRYEIVYGRRRVEALKRLGQPVKAMLRNLNTRDLIVAQGQENAARKDLSFIEKTNFARQMDEQGFKRKIICDALHIDKTVISRMMAVADALPHQLILAIGAAPAVGRDRWLALAERIKERELAELLPLIDGDDSNTRFQTLFTALETPAPAPIKANPPAPLTGLDGAALGEVKTSAKGAQIKLTDAEFSGWLIENIEEIHRLFLENPGE